MQEFSNSFRKLIELATHCIAFLSLNSRCSLIWRYKWLQEVCQRDKLKWHFVQNAEIVTNMFSLYSLGTFYSEICEQLLWYIPDKLESLLLFGSCSQVYSIALEDATKIRNAYFTICLQLCIGNMIVNIRMPLILMHEFQTVEWMFNSISLVLISLIFLL